jgi:phage shock protein A
MADKFPKLAELLEQLRSDIADVAQARERVKESMTALAQAQAKLGQQAETARRFGREDLSQTALARQEAARSQLAALALKYDQLLAEKAKLEAKLSAAARALQAKIDALSRLSERTGRPARKKSAGLSCALHSRWHGLRWSVAGIHGQDKRPLSFKYRGRKSMPSHFPSL